MLIWDPCEQEKEEVNRSKFKRGNVDRKLIW